MAFAGAVNGATDDSDGHPSDMQPPVRYFSGGCKRTRVSVRVQPNSQSLLCTLLLIYAEYSPTPLARMPIYTVYMNVYQQTDCFEHITCNSLHNDSW